MAAVALLAVDPAGLRGLWLRARAGPVRDRVVAALAAMPLPLQKLHPGIADEALYGGLDLAATLALGRQVRSAGLLAVPSTLILAMAERCPSGLAARLAQALDRPGHALVALDEGAAADEGLPGALADRLALFLDLDDVPWSEIEDPETADIMPDAAHLCAARARLQSVSCPPEALTLLTAAAARMGIESLRAPLLALGLARASAAWRGGDVDEGDLRLAAQLVLAHRGTLPPEDADAPQEPPDTPDQDDPPDNLENDNLENDNRPPDEMLIEAARAALPPGLMAELAAGRALRAARGTAGSGAGIKGNRRERPLPSRPGRIGAGARIDLVATLRSAAPWQAIRRAQAAAHMPANRLHIRPADIRLKRFQQRSDRVLIFMVDASGSAAFARLAEAKGAVELLLAAAYARRDHVALVAFRGTGAEVLLPPTRSLVQTRRRLAGLPGGGGTPLALGLEAGLALARQVQARGMTPTLALLTDGRANIDLNGQPGRAQAGADAHRIARLIAASATPSVVIDTAMRPEPGLRALADVMIAVCLPLPRADARRLSAALGAAMDTPGGRG